AVALARDRCGCACLPLVRALRLPRRWLDLAGFVVLVGGLPVVRLSAGLCRLRPLADRETVTAAPAASAAPAATAAAALPASLLAVTVTGRATLAVGLAIAVVVALVDLLDLAEPHRRRLG